MASIFTPYYIYTVSRKVQKEMKRYFLLIITTLMMFSANTARAQMLAVNTDVAMDACLAPSLGVELTMSKKSSLNFNALYGRKILGKDMMILAIQPEWRVYLSGRPMYHHYVGAIGLLTRYDMELGSKLYKGDAFGIGVSFGYVLPITDRLMADFHASVGDVF